MTSMGTTRWGAISAISALAVLAACGSSGTESLQGTWSGSIFCLGDTSDLTLGLFAESDEVWGTAQIRTKGSNADYKVEGGARQADRLVECHDPICTSDADCADRLDAKGQGGRIKCNLTSSMCTPCYQNESWWRVGLTLRDANVQIPDPVLDLWRFGVQSMEGTVKSFCPDEAQQTPKVQLVKK